MRTTFSGVLIAAITFGSITLAANQADAALMAFICDDLLCTGGGDTIVTDQGVGDNFPGSAVVGQINAGALSVGGFTIVTNVSQSKPLIGTAANPQLDLTFSAVTSDNLAHTIYLYATDNNFTGSGGSLLTIGGTQPGGGNSVTGSAWGGTSNNTFDLSNQIATFTNSGTPFSNSSFALFSPSAPYSLTIGVAITRTTAGTTTGDLHLEVGDDVRDVPEPASAVLLGLALSGLVVRSRRSLKGR